MDKNPAQHQQQVQTQLQNVQDSQQIKNNTSLSPSTNHHQQTFLYQKTKNMLFSGKNKVQNQGQEEGKIHQNNGEDEGFKDDPLNDDFENVNFDSPTNIQKAIQIQEQIQNEPTQNYNQNQQYFGSIEQVQANQQQTSQEQAQQMNQSQNQPQQQVPTIIALPYQNQNMDQINEPTQNQSQNEGRKDNQNQNDNQNDNIHDKTNQSPHLSSSCQSKSSLIPQIISIQQNMMQKRKNKQSIDLCNLQIQGVSRQNKIIVKDQIKPTNKNNLLNGTKNACLIQYEQLQKSQGNQIPQQVKLLKQNIHHDYQQNRKSSFARHGQRQLEPITQAEFQKEYNQWKQNQKIVVKNHADIEQKLLKRQQNLDEGFSKLIKQNIQEQLAMIESKLSKQQEQPSKINKQEMVKLPKIQNYRIQQLKNQKLQLKLFSASSQQKKGFVQEEYIHPHPIRHSAKYQRYISILIDRLSNYLDISDKRQLLHNMPYDDLMDYCKNIMEKKDIIYFWDFQRDLPQPEDEMEIEQPINVEEQGQESEGERVMQVQQAYKSPHKKNKWQQSIDLSSHEYLQNNPIQIKDFNQSSNVLIQKTEKAENMGIQVQQEQDGQFIIPKIKDFKKNHHNQDRQQQNKQKQYVIEDNSFQMGQVNISIEDPENYNSATNVNVNGKVIEIEIQPQQAQADKQKLNQIKEHLHLRRPQQQSDQVVQVFQIQEQTPVDMTVQTIVRAVYPPNYNNEQTKDNYGSIQNNSWPNKKQQTQNFSQKVLIQKIDQVVKVKQPNNEINNQNKQEPVEPSQSQDGSMREIIVSGFKGTLSIQEIQNLSEEELRSKLKQSVPESFYMILDSMESQELKTLVRQVMGQININQNQQPTQNVINVQTQIIEQKQVNSQVQEQREEVRPQNNSQHQIIDINKANVQQTQVKELSHQQNPNVDGNGNVVSSDNAIIIDSTTNNKNGQNENELQDSFFQIPKLKPIQDNNQAGSPGLNLTVVNCSSHPVQQQSHAQNHSQKVQNSLIQLKPPMVNKSSEFQQQLKSQNVVIQSETNNNQHNPQVNQNANNSNSIQINQNNSQSANLIEQQAQHLQQSGIVQIEEESRVVTLPLLEINQKTNSNANPFDIQKLNKISKKKPVLEIIDLDDIEEQVPVVNSNNTESSQRNNQNQAQDDLEIPKLKNIQQPINVQVSVPNPSSQIQQESPQINLNSIDQDIEDKKTFVMQIRAVLNQLHPQMAQSINQMSDEQIFDMYRQLGKEQNQQNQQKQGQNQMEIQQNNAQESSKNSVKQKANSNVKIHVDQKKAESSIQTQHKNLNFMQDEQKSRRQFLEILQTLQELPPAARQNLAVLSKQQIYQLYIELIGQQEEQLKQAKQAKQAKQTKEAKEALQKQDRLSKKSAKQNQPGQKKTRAQLQQQKKQSTKKANVIAQVIQIQDSKSQQSFMSNRKLRINLKQMWKFLIDKDPKNKIKIARDETKRKQIQQSVALIYFQVLRQNKKSNGWLQPQNKTIILNGHNKNKSKPASKAEMKIFLSLQEKKMDRQKYNRIKENQQKKRKLKQSEKIMAQQSKQKSKQKEKIRQIQVVKKNNISKSVINSIAENISTQFIGNNKPRQMQKQMKMQVIDCNSDNINNNIDDNSQFESFILPTVAVDNKHKVDTLPASVPSLNDKAILVPQSKSQNINKNSNNNDNNNDNKDTDENYQNMRTYVFVYLQATRRPNLSQENQLVLQQQIVYDHNKKYVKKSQTIQDEQNKCSCCTCKKRQTHTDSDMSKVIERMLKSMRQVDAKQRHKL